MVFCGKPSKACESCRARRIKCDFKKPACTQCTKISKVCPGYRDQLDLFFRDESAAVVRKVQRKQKAKASPAPSQPPSKSSSPEAASPFSSGSSDSDDGSLFTDPFFAMDMDLAALNWSPAIPIEEVARCHFMESFIRGSHFDYLPKLCGTTLSDGPLLATINANACANFFRETGDPQLAIHAQKYYAQALRQTNTAMMSIDKAVLDSTLASILLLGLYDTLTQTKRSSPESFVAHNNGAAALLKIRGKEQFDNEMGCKIYSHVSMNLRVSCAQRETPLPLDFLELQNEILDRLDEKDPMTGFFFIIDGFARLRQVARAEYAAGELTTATIDDALRYDQALVTLIETTPPALGYKKITIPGTEEGVLGNTYHEYRDHRLAQRWNALRMMRLLFNEHIYGHMARIVSPTVDPDNVKLSTTSYLLQELARRNVEEMAREICASVPQFCKLNQYGILPVTPAAFLLWPLAIAGQNELSPPEIHEYAIDRLRFMGTEARLPQGVWAAEMLEDNKKDMEDWLYLSHLA